LCFGLNADWDVVPDVGDFAADLRNAFSELLRAAQDQGSALATPLRQRRQRRRAL
jgi:hypothetical protein